MSEVEKAQSSEASSSNTAKVDMAEVLSVTSRKASRDSLAADIEAFLASGGKIQQVEAGASADEELQA